MRLSSEESVIISTLNHTSLQVKNHTTDLTQNDLQLLVTCFIASKLLSKPFSYFLFNYFR